MDSLAANLGKCTSEPDIPLRPPVRPKFHHHNTNDRIREGSGRPLSVHMIGKIRKDRKSVFKELGLDTDDSDLGFTDERVFGEITGLTSPVEKGDRSVRFSAERGSETGSDDGRGEQKGEGEVASPTSPTGSQKSSWYSRPTPGRRPKIRTTASAPPPGMSGMSRLTTIALLIAVVLPGFGYYNGREKVAVSGADAGVIQERPKGFGPVLDTRAPSPTKVCKRWSQQSKFSLRRAREKMLIWDVAALLNGTLYVYGGQAKTTADQKSDTWSELLPSRSPTEPELTQLR